MFREFEERARKARQAQTAQPTMPTNPVTRPIGDALVLPPLNPTPINGRNPLRPAPAPAKQSSIRRIHNLMATMWGSVSIGTQLANASTTSNIYRKTNLVGYEQQFTGSIKSVVFLNKLFIASTTNGIYTSSDGITWIQKQSGAFSKVIFENSLFVAIGSGGIYTSSNGSTWTQRLDKTTTDIICINDIFVSTCFSDGIYTSSDGITWTQKDTGAFMQIIFENSMFVAVGSSGVSVSGDGDMWTKVISRQSFTAVCFENGVFLLTKYQATIKKSTDGVSWTNTTEDGSDKVIAKNGVFIFYGEGLKVTSDNGITFSYKLPYRVYNHVTEQSRVVFATDGGYYQTTDGTNFTPVENSDIQTLLTVQRSELNI